MDTALQESLRRQLEEERDRERDRLDDTQIVEEGKSVHNIMRSEAGSDLAAQQVRQRSEDLGSRDHTESRLGQIEAALARMDDGSYGTCEVCGRPIAEERLRALPLTSLCREHAEEAGDDLDPAARIEG
jgi:RNA polymerase-binding transcription factor DksA